MTKKKVTRFLWDFGLVHENELLSRMTNSHRWTSGCEEITRDMTNIAEQFDFEFYDLVWWQDCNNKPDMKKNS